ncbi:MAG: TlpA family protein disulfide reductase [Elusimicrobia bacterium]|nr:TlpA family protein disulfide reductase [Elusimicrobiota bacterium]MDE2312693.1 TlpA family protein disulfide reductase [Elusimicrobiota bacterium]
MPNPVTRLFWKAAIRLRWLLPSKKASGVEIGRRIPDFALSNAEGRSFRLSSVFPDKAAVLWLTNLCSSCQERIPLLERVYSEKRKNLEIFAISTLGDDRRTPEIIAAEHHPSFPLLLDPKDWVKNTLGLEHPSGACPMYNLLMLDRSGRVRLRHHLSAIPDERFLKELDSLLEAA